METDFIKPSDRKTIVLVGMMGAGKTTTGFALSQRLNIKFVDSDREIERMENDNITNVFNTKGEESFKELERKVIFNLIKSPRPQVLSIGGNAFDDEVIRERIKERTISVFLDVELEVLLDRVMRRNTRPILEGGDKKAIMTDIYNKKISVYREADICVNTTYLSRETSINVIVKSIADYIRDYSNRE